jgi:hypothetical protein
LGVLRHGCSKGNIHPWIFGKRLGVRDRGTQIVIQKVWRIQLIDGLTVIITTSKVYRGRKGRVWTGFGVFGMGPTQVEYSRFRIIG